MALALDGSVGTNVTGGVSTITLPALTTTNGNVVVIVGALVNDTKVISSISDDAGLTWAKRAGANGIEEWYAVSAAALSSDVITITLDGGTNFATACAFGISGADTSSTFDGTAHTAAGSVSITTTNADDFIIGLYRFSATASPTAGTGFTTIYGANFFLAEYQIVSATQSSLSIPVGTGAGDQNGGIADAVKQASAGGGTVIVPWPLLIGAI